MHHAGRPKERVEPTSLRRGREGRHARSRRVARRARQTQPPGSGLDWSGVTSDALVPEQLRQRVGGREVILGILRSSGQRDGPASTTGFSLTTRRSALPHSGRDSRSNGTTSGSVRRHRATDHLSQSAQLLRPPPRLQLTPASSLTTTGSPVQRPTTKPLCDDDQRRDSAGCVGASASVLAQAAMFHVKRATARGYDEPVSPAQDRRRRRLPIPPHGD